ncbi:hypothetical protein LINPERHAP1_LOCUS13329, partial [Linum perenne]
SPLPPRLIPKLPLLIYATTWTTLPYRDRSRSFLFARIRFRYQLLRRCSHRILETVEGKEWLGFRWTFPEKCSACLQNCLPSRDIDFLVPPVFAAVVVAGAAWVVRSIGLWEGEEEAG